MHVVRWFKGLIKLSSLCFWPIYFIIYCANVAYVEGFTSEICWYERIRLYAPRKSLFYALSLSAATALLLRPVASIWHMCLKRMCYSNTCLLMHSFDVVVNVIYFGKINKIQWWVWCAIRSFVEWRTSLQQFVSAISTTYIVHRSHTRSYNSTYRWCSFFSSFVYARFHWIVHDAILDSLQKRTVNDFGAFYNFTHLHNTDTAHTRQTPHNLSSLKHLHTMLYVSTRESFKYLSEFGIAFSKNSRTPLIHGAVCKTYMPHANLQCTFVGTLWACWIAEMCREPKQCKCVV